MKLQPRQFLASVHVHVLQLAEPEWKRVWSDQPVSQGLASLNLEVEHERSWGAGEFLTPHSTAKTTANGYKAAVRLGVRTEAYIWDRVA